MRLENSAIQNVHLVKMVSTQVTSLEMLSKIDSLEYSIDYENELVQQVEASKQECIDAVAETADTKNRLRNLYEQTIEANQKEESVAQSIELMKMDLLKVW